MNKGDEVSNPSYHTCLPQHERLEEGWQTEAVVGSAKRRALVQQKTKRPFVKTIYTNC